MKSFKFNVHGGATVELTDDSITISVVGVKGWIFQRIKSRTKTVPFNEIVRFDYKKANITVGYLRIITPDYEEYPSSLYVAEHDPQAFIFDKDDMHVFTQLMMELQKVTPNIKKQEHKM